LDGVAKTGKCGALIRLAGSFARLLIQTVEAFEQGFFDTLRQ
jgi:hypothetical protein